MNWIWTSGLLLTIFTWTESELPVYGSTHSSCQHHTHLPRTSHRGHHSLARLAQERYITLSRGCRHHVVFSRCRYLEEEKEAVVIYWERICEIIRVYHHHHHHQHNIMYVCMHVLYVLYICMSVSTYICMSVYFQNKNTQNNNKGKKKNWREKYQVKEPQKQQ